jgi:hypothetical protein
VNGTGQWKGGIILGGTLLVGVAAGVAGTLLLPRVAETYLPDLLGRPALVEAQVIKKQREPNRVLLKVQTDQGPVLATFTTRVAEVDLLVEPGDRILLRLPRDRTFVDDPALERVTGSTSTAPAGGPPMAGSP